MEIGPLVSPRLLTVGPRHPLRDVARKMTERRIGSAVVICDDGRPGIITERDVLRAVADGADPETARVEDYMTATPITASPHCDVHRAAARMREGGVRHLVVVDDDGNCIGVLSIRDLVQSLLEELSAGKPAGV